MDNSEFGGYLVGDYVIATSADYDTFHDTFVVTGFSRSMFNEPIIKVRLINATTSDSGTVFYPWELLYEDGSRPA